MAVLEERVDRLEEMVMRLVYIQQKTEIEMQKLQKEMKEFKNEMKEFKDAIQKDTENPKREMKGFKDKSEKFEKWAKETIEENHKWSKREVRRMNKQWGELANKMGTIVEDIVFPATRPVIKKYFKCDPEILMMNVRKKDGEFNEEFDVIAVCEDKTFLIEVKSTLRTKHTEHMKRKEERFKELFPEYAKGEVIPIVASLKIEKEVLNKLTKEEIYGMAYSEWEYMDILNFEEVLEKVKENS